ncbi:MAG TPA: hypothetical protein VGN17_00450 [Bryobacteraceae bacterium]|jgi:hypothetical protein
MSNYRDKGVTFKTTRTSGVDVPSVNVDNITVDLTGATLDPTNLALEQGHLVALAPVPGVAQHIAYTTHAESTTVGVTLIELCATTDCHIVIGGSPVATANSTYLPAKTIKHYSCQITDKVSVIQDSTGGTLYITPCS